MKRITVNLDEQLVSRVDGVVDGPGGRTEFIRRAIVAALADLEEQATANAYARFPDEPALLTADAWEPRKQ